MSAFRHRWLPGLGLGVSLLGSTVWAQTPPKELEEGGAVEAAEETSEGEGYTPPAGASLAPALIWMGYVDIGFARAQGDGSSFPPGDTRLPADYGVDAFAPAVNSRGDVASNSAGDRFTNGFLPRSVAIGGRSSFLLNVVNLDVKYAPGHLPLMAFVRMQLLPRFGGDGAGNRTSLYLEQAFGRITPFSSRELHLSLGKFDSVFGIEYLDNPSSFRIGITPSLMARYTTGTSVGAKAFYRQQIAPLWSAVSLNVAATNSGSMIEALQPPDASLTGQPVLSARLGYELNLPDFQIKAGASGLWGPRNDQHDQTARQTLLGADGRLYLFGFSVAGEYVHVDEDEGTAPKQTGQGESPLASEFHARGFWVQAAYGWMVGWRALRAVTPFARYERRHAWFEGFRALTVDRLTAGLRVELWQNLIVKGEYLVNGEREGAPQVANNVFTSSVVFTW